MGPHIWAGPVNNKEFMNRGGGHAQRGFERAALTQHPACSLGACRRCDVNAASNVSEPVPRQRHVSRHMCLSSRGCTKCLNLSACLYTSGWHWLQV